MSLRLRLFTMLGGLILLLLLAQWWWVWGLMRGLDADVDEVVLRVSTSVVKAVAPSRVHVERVISDSAGCAEGEPCSYSFEIAERDCAPGDAACHDAASVEETPIHALPDGARVVERHLVMRLEASGDADTVVDWTAAAPPAAGHAPRIFAFATDARRADVRFIPIPDADLKARVGRFSRHLLLGTGALLLAGLVAAAVVAQRVSAPLRQLSEAAERVGDGALGTRVGAVSSDHDVGRALGAFNRMSARLVDLDHAHRSLAERQHLSEIGDIARGLAHSLRNPLNALGLSLEELAARAAPGDESDHLARAARRQIRRIDHSVRSFLALASHGGAVEPVDLGALAHDVALEVLQDAGGRVRFDVRVPEPLEPLPAVAAELRAVVQALVVNAAEASPDGATVEIDVRSGDAQRLSLVVADRGSGLADAVRARLFTPHQTTKAHGSGMGLFLAQRIATTRYGGDLVLDDRAGGGTRATLVVGARRDEPDATAGQAATGDD